MRIPVRDAVVVFLVSFLVPIVGCQTATRTRTDARGARYLETVRAYADTMIAKGRDTCGPEHSPLFACTLVRTTFQLLDELPPIEGIRRHDRSHAGGNPMHDEDFYRLLYDLTEVTGQPVYAEEADKALAFFFAHAQSPATGLFAWGEHLHWEFAKEAMDGNDIHEFYRPWLLTDVSYRLAPEAMARYARGLWDHQIADHEKGYYSRHAMWSHHETFKGMEFPRHGGFYVAQWADAYTRTKDPVFVVAITCLLDYVERVRDPKTMAVPNKSPEITKDPVCWVFSPLSQAIDMETAAPKVTPDLAKRLRVAAHRNDVAFLRLPHDPGTPSKGFVAQTAFGGTGTPELQGYTPAWATGYGITTSAGAAMMCYERYLQTRNAAYKRLVVRAASMYLESDPEQSVELYPGAVGDVIYLMIAAHRLTHDQRYLERAGHFADLGSNTFWEGTPLPRASSRTHHYESITRCDTLARAMLLLAAELDGRHLPTAYVDR